MQLLELCRPLCIVEKAKIFGVLCGVLKWDSSNYEGRTVLMTKYKGKKRLKQPKFQRTGADGACLCLGGGGVFFFFSHCLCRITRTIAIVSLDNLQRKRDKVCCCAPFELLVLGSSLRISREESAKHRKSFLTAQKRAKHKWPCVFTLVWPHFNLVLKN